MKRELSKREIGQQLAADRAAVRAKEVAKAQAVRAKEVARRRAELTREIAALKKSISSKKPFPATFRAHLAQCEKDLRNLR